MRPVVYVRMVDELQAFAQAGQVVGRGCANEMGFAFVGFQVFLKRHNAGIFVIWIARFQSIKNTQKPCDIARLLQ